MRYVGRSTFLATLILSALVLACSGAGTGDAGGRSDGDGPALLLAIAALDSENGAPKPLPARLGVLVRGEDGWSHRVIEDPDSNVFHKAMAYGTEGEPQGVLTLGGSDAAVKLWKPDGETLTLWEADFGGEFSRMRDAEVGDIYGDGSASIAVATHDQGVVAVIRPDGAGGFSVEELDAAPDTIIHEIELGDLDADGTLEIYATPSEPNRMDGSSQAGSVVRYVPADDRGPEQVADLGRRHAKEILVDDLDGDGVDELYVSVEAVSGGRVEVRRYRADTAPDAGETVARLDDKLSRFLTAGDVDGDGSREMVAATLNSGLWLLRPAEGGWRKERIDADSSGFEHASILLDLDGDGRDELYVASDNQNEVRRYDWSSDGWTKEVLLRYTDGLGRFTWNIMPAPAGIVPDPS